MGAVVLVLGESGSGKTASLRNFKKDDLGLLNVLGKKMPFRSELQSIDNARYNQILQAFQSNKRKCYVVDDANYLMQLANFAKAEERGYDKFTKMAMDFERMLEAAMATDDETIVYVLMHPQYDDAGNAKPKTIGKMLDNQLTIEGLVSMTLVAFGDENGYHFRTNDPNGIAKSPMGMFDAEIIDNDLAMVDATARAYWGMKPLSTSGSRAASHGTKGGDAA